VALKIDVELAKSITDRKELEEDDEMRKKLWLKIARHVVDEDGNIKQAMLFLQESGDLLKIEDILPFFPDFVTIDHFKDALCESLSEYNKSIEHLKEEMSYATASAHSIRLSIQQSKDRHLVVGATEQCYTCDRHLLRDEAVYAFPCQHFFHQNCLLSEIRPMLIDAKREIVDELYQTLLELSKLSDVTLEQKQIKRELVEKLDEIIAAECVLCGEIAVDNIDAPFTENIPQQRASTADWL